MKIDSGKKIDEIKVVISKRIIELFSAGLYSSPNKAFEELVCNSYDAAADKVSVYVPSDLTTSNSMIWVCDNGSSMNQEELKDLWKVGESNKKRGGEDSGDRLQIGRFGIGKLATYILARNLTYICKKDGRYIATKMDYAHISNEEDLILDEIELSEEEAKIMINPIIKYNGKDLTSFLLFGENSEKTWTLSIMTELKPKAYEIKEGRLKWILKTALPLSPGFKLYYNGQNLESSKINIPLVKSWTVGEEDETASKIDGCLSNFDGENFYIDLPNLKGVRGRFELFEDTLVDGKSVELGRSYGIFLTVRGRLINLDDPLLGMEAFSHGAFNRCRIMINADELDDNIASTRETIKESQPYHQLKEYIKKKFNNEVRKYYFDKENLKELESSLSYRITQTPTSLSKTPIITFVKKCFSGEVISPWLLEKPEFAQENKQAFIDDLELELQNNSILNGEPSWEYMAQSDPLAKYDIVNRKLKINLMHPFIANYSDQIKSKLPIEFIATAEVLTEAHMYEIGINEDSIHSIMRRRDRIIRELVFSDRLSAPLVVNIIKDALADPTGLEEAVYKAFLTLGFEANKIGGNGTPDGKATAILGYTEANKCENYSLTYDAKSSGKQKIQAGTAKLSAVNRHRSDYSSDFAVVIAIDFEGSSDPESAISIEARQQCVTVMKAQDLMRLLLLAVPKQLGLKKIKELFETCYAPMDVTKWIDELAATNVEKGPINELLDVIYDYQRTDSEPPELASVRVALNTKMNKNYSKLEIKDLLSSLRILVPNFINMEGDKVGLNQNPKVVKQAIDSATNSVPLDFQQLYIDALQIK